MVRLAPGVDNDRLPAGCRRRADQGAGSASPRPAGRGLRVADGAAQGPGHADPGLAARAGAACRAGPRPVLLIWSASGPVRAQLGTAGAAARRGRLGALHRVRAVGRPARLLRRRQRLRDAVPDQAGRPGRRGPRHRLPGSVGDRPAGHRRRLRRRAGRDPPGETGYVVHGRDAAAAGRPADPAARRPGGAGDHGGEGPGLGRPGVALGPGRRAAWPRSWSGGPARSFSCRAPRSRRRSPWRPPPASPSATASGARWPR